MTLPSAHRAYAQQQVYTASPAKLVLMCYEHAIGALNDAIRAIEENNIEKRWKANTKATEIITHMWSTLDMEGGGEIAKNLDQLYNLILSKLPAVDFKNDAQTARDIIKLLEPLRDAWRDLASKYSEQDLAKARSEAEANNPQPKEEASAAPQPIPVSPPPSAPASAPGGTYGQYRPRVPTAAPPISAHTFSA